MTFRRSAPAALIAVAALVIAVITWATHWMFTGLTAATEASQFELMQAAVARAIGNGAVQALARAEIVAASSTTKQAVAARDRTRLLEEYAEMFQVQKERRGVDQAAFHIPPATSLLRLQAPDNHGDDLTKFRPMVVAVNREHNGRGGPALGRTGPAVFGVAPVTDKQGQHIGSFEFGLDLAPMLDSLKAAYGFDFALFIEEKPLREYARGVDPAKLSDQNRVGRFMRFHTTNKAVMTDLVGESDIATVTEPTHYTRESQNLTYGVLQVPLRDSAGSPIGVISVARDFSATRAAVGRAFAWQLWLAICGLVILAGAIVVVIRGFLLRPLDVINERFAAMESGKPPAPLPPGEKFCAEITELARHQERLLAARA
ncbi:MAG TPA: cache domain-containing protein [Pseudolabrys sp.]|jgi:methyl-accepting chemotaxis protein|nr:cache domain-containing protein [Pseudolabrys sp.]